MNKLILNPPMNITMVNDLEGLSKLQDFFNRNKVFGWDLETNPMKDYFWRKTRTIQFGNREEQYVVDMLAWAGGDVDKLVNSQGHYGMFLDPCFKPLFDVITPVLTSREFLKVGVNLGFEYQNFYWQFGIRTQYFFSCDMVERCIWAGAHGLKDYPFFSMASMFGRYFNIEVEKGLQESFTVDGVLTPEQIEYAAIDTRLPLVIKMVQELILNGETFKSLSEKGLPAAKLLKNIDPQLLGDNLVEIAQIENDAIGAFEDMHIHGERLDRVKWKIRVAKEVEELAGVIKNELDPVFLPLCGSKLENITDEEIDRLTAEWKTFNVVPDDELLLKSQIRSTFDINQKIALETQRQEKETQRKTEKEKLKEVCSTLKKKRTRIRTLAAKCQGEALINYASGAQFRKWILQLPEIKKLEDKEGNPPIQDTEDETLEKFKKFPVIAAFQKYRKLSKRIGTYGDSWATEWVTKPCKEEGWLHPGDGRLHCQFGQYDAETGRSTSSQPNAQNLPTDKEVRSSFVVDPPDEDEPDGYVLVTADMSGAELRIIAELANDDLWIGAFDRDEDVHSVGTELLFPEEWPRGTMPDCAYFKLKENGDPQRKKCSCPNHKKLRDGNKSTNFLLAYGGTETKLSVEIGTTLAEAKKLIQLHEKKNPRIWQFLAESAAFAAQHRKCFDMFGRRRIFPEPTWERAKEYAKEDNEEKLRYSDEEIEANKARFMAYNNRKPDETELWELCHNSQKITSRMVSRALWALKSGIERQGKNTPIQSANATIAKIAIGAGYDKEGKPFLWHILPQYKAKILKFVHDEFVVQCPRRFGKQVADAIADCFLRAAALKMKRVKMLCDFNIADHWKK